MDLGQTLKDSFNTAMATLVSAIPAIIGAIVILIVGWIIGAIVGRIVTGILARTPVDRTFNRHAGSVYGGSASTFSVSRATGTVVKWLIFLVFLIAATNFLGWPLLTDFLNQVILFIPNLIVAVLILILAPIAGRLVRNAVENGTAAAGVSSGHLLGRVAEVAVILFGVIIAVNQVGVASNLVDILFTGLVIALAIAFGLAFGLGGRDVAGQLLQSWYDGSRDAATKLAAAGNAGVPGVTTRAASTETTSTPPRSDAAAAGPDAASS
jgi:hypothetical protein